MGQWSERENRPFTNIDRCVHMADYMASRSFIDIPMVSDEWCTATAIIETDGIIPTVVPFEYSNCVDCMECDHPCNA